MESQHMTQQVFADFIGTTPATLSGIFNDRTRPTINIVESIKKKIPDISTDWLMFGQGTMFQQPQSQNGDVRQSDGSLPTNGLSNEPMIDFENAASNSARMSPSSSQNYNSVRNTPSNFVREEIKIFDKPKRHVTEIRVYYDDQTWESFVPSKK